MKKFIYSILGCALLFTACSDDETHITPSDISNVSHISRPGAVLLRWDVPADSNYFYVKVSYHDPWTNQNVLKLASVYSDTIVIDNMLKRFGKYSFTLQTVSSTGDLGTPLVYNHAESLARPAETTVSSTNELDLTESMLSTNSQETSEGPLANVLDGNVETFFHSRWSGNNRPWPAWIDINAGEPLSAFTFKYVTRNNGGKHKPKTIVVEGSNDGTNFTEIITLNEGLPSAAGATYNSPTIVVPNDGSYQYIRLKVTEVYEGTQWFCFAELGLSKCILSVYDPEKD